MRRFLAAALLAAGVLAGSAAADDASTFQTPSKNIGCIYIPPYAGHPAPYLRCDIGGGLHPLPPRPKNCDLDWGYGYQMSGASGRARPFCAGDTAKDAKARVLAYGRTWHRGPFTCRRRRSA